MGFNVSDVVSRIKNISSNLSTSLSNQSSRMSALSTQTRVQSSLDEPAGAVQARGMQSQYSRISGKVMQVNDVVSKVSVGSDSVTKIADATDQMRELATQASNESLSADDRAALNTQYQNLRATVDDVSKNATYNGQNLLDGTAKVVMASDLVSDVPGRKDKSYSIAAISSDSLGLSTDILSVDSAKKAKEALDNADTTVRSAQSIFDVARNDAENKLQELSVTQENIAAVQKDSRLLDIDSAENAANLASSSILRQRDMASFAQVNASSSLVMQLLR